MGHRVSRRRQQCTVGRVPSRCGGTDGWSLGNAEDLGEGDRSDPARSGVRRLWHAPPSAGLKAPLIGPAPVRHTVYLSRRGIFSRIIQPWSRDKQDLREMIRRAGGARYKQSLDPTVDEVKKLCTSLRRNAKEERVLFHYNGHGVPRPTVNGEIWVFNKNYTQYIPLSIYDLQTWMGSPSIFVYDCSNAGIIVKSFKQFALQREQELEVAAINPNHPLAQMPCPLHEELHPAGSLRGQRAAAHEPRPARGPVSPPA
ncbi:hypothetical protein ANANG_G00029120 [Anguilla anguilla]|uniref:Raptor N-terminal CASPase-like domain-containing protein n=1 Tax=Anguilla anguilla TaxID=7936 RepID=A0A9D3MUT2_ANGAN|nr:hypothetical protein ANANG_G00029120 [Anguilla anguilla]